MTTREITLENLNEAITTNDVVLLDFWASWCGPCRAFAPVYEHAAETHPDVVFGMVDTEEQQQLASAFHVKSIPTLIVFREGVLVFGQPGPFTDAQLTSLIEGVHGLDMEKVRARLASEQSETVKAAR